MKSNSASAFVYFEKGETYGCVFWQSSLLFNNTQLLGTSHGILVFVALPDLEHLINVLFLKLLQLFCRWAAFDLLDMDGFADDNVHWLPPWQ